MQEPEVSLRIAMKYIRDGKTSENVTVSIDGAHISTGDVIHFDLSGFMKENNYEKCGEDDGRWQGEYRHPDFLPRIVVVSRSGEGDVNIILKDGTRMFVESKKIRSGNGGEYPAMREAVGQLMTGCPEGGNVVPVAAVPYSARSEKLAREWSLKERIRAAGIRFLLVRDCGDIELI